ncbi:hypothetical protein Drose_09770 [Dactylosporangium roseum]|uniref:C2H2-type domain-containing protein n=1 Tax=Dactylosporangium roseum TaxID=47989 RepID=A0ABY5ZCR9_9ACTN|nr:hypothetical protein [Dactylosporangium roseum]UWZ38493.1 hypothetical protein Drose_09770 [Dactylosporangium roseum]
MRTDDDPWRGIVPPFRMLDPSLAGAARLPLLDELIAALPDERRAAGRLNSALPVLRLRLTGDRWRLVVDEPFALALLVVAGGWQRLKRCPCGAPFVDRTAATTRRHCAAHLRHGVRRPAFGGDLGIVVPDLSEKSG